jgi:hypothetical protein
MNKLYKDFLTCKYGKLRWVTTSYGYFEIMSESTPQDVIAHIGMLDEQGGLSIHLSHIDSASSWFNLTDRKSKHLIKEYILDYYKCSGSDDLRNILTREYSNRQVPFDHFWA